jgi:hypothetical protein
MGVIEKHTPKVVREHDVGIDVQPPTGVLAAREARIQSRAFIEASAVLMKQIGLDANCPMLARHGVGRFVVVRSDDDHRIDVGMVALNVKSSRSSKPTQAVTASSRSESVAAFSGTDCDA